MPNVYAEGGKTHSRTIDQVKSDHEGRENEGKGNDNHEKHFVLFTLLNTLLPDVVLMISLLRIIAFTKSGNILKQLVTYILQAKCVPLKQALESLTHA